MPRATNAKGAPLVEAIDWNKRLWRTLAADCMDDRNTLTQDVRAKIVSLSLWVSKYSRKVTREKAPIDPLIEINRTIMQGLQGRPADAIHRRLRAKRRRAPRAGFFVPSRVRMLARSTLGQRQTLPLRQIMPNERPPRSKIYQVKSIA